MHPRRVTSHILFFIGLWLIPVPVGVFHPFRPLAYSILKSAPRLLILAGASPTPLSLWPFHSSGHGTSHPIGPLACSILVSTCLFPFPAPFGGCISPQWGSCPFHFGGPLPLSFPLHSSGHIPPVWAPSPFHSSGCVLPPLGRLPIPFWWGF